LSYKPNIDDLRESPSLEIAQLLREKGYNVVGCEPNVQLAEIGGIRNIALEEILKIADYIVLTLAHDEFKNSINKILQKHVLNVIGL